MKTEPGPPAPIPPLESYELRSTPGPDYSAQNETTLAQSATGFGLPGNAVSYKIYVRLTTGNEAGSDPLTITRPF